MSFREAQFPCGCRAWRYGRDEGFCPCPPHMMEHQAIRMMKDMSGGFQFEAIKCDCLQHRAERAKRSPFDYILDRHEEELAIWATRVPALPDKDENDIPLIEFSDRCACVWERHGGLWRISFPCMEHIDRVSREEARRNHRPPEGPAADPSFLSS